ncbi:hypothetical protein MHYP_G00207090 [Metynnis hypsauchen]
MPGHCSHDQRTLRSETPSLRNLCSMRLMRGMRSQLIHGPDFPVFPVNLLHDPMHTHRSYHSDYSSSSESPSVTSSDPDYKHAKRSDEMRRFGSQAGLSESDGVLLGAGQRHRC